jgi:hypothetical protein
MTERQQALEEARCGNCANFSRCQWLFGCDATNTECDWMPSRFVYYFASQPSERPAEA